MYNEAAQKRIDEYEAKTPRQKCKPDEVDHADAQSKTTRLI